jgi:hypothetical protein
LKVCAGEAIAVAAQSRKTAQAAFQPRNLLTLSFPVFMLPPVESGDSALNV